MSKPVNCFLLFCRDERNAVIQQFPEKNNSEITSELGKRWREMSPEEQIKYKNAAFENTKKFWEQNPNYKPKKKAESKFITTFRISSKFRSCATATHTIKKDSASKHKRDHEQKLPSVPELLQIIFPSPTANPHQPVKDSNVIK